MLMHHGTKFKVWFFMFWGFLLSNKVIIIFGTSANDVLRLRLFDFGHFYARFLCTQSNLTLVTSLCCSTV